jgi:phytoene synthase
VTHPNLHLDVAAAQTSLEASYRANRALHRRHGTTYYWATRLLPAANRRHVHALYGFCRYADEIVDHPGKEGVAGAARRLARLEDRLFTDLGRGRSDDLLLAALVDTVLTLEIDPDVLRRFLTAMTMDLSVARYSSWNDLCGYMDGSAAAVGEMMLPVLQPSDRSAALEPARALGLAFQFTNFLRDVGEDLDRGRVYIPAQDLAHFGADPWRRVVTPEWIELMQFETQRARVLYCEADRGIGYLSGRAAACVRTARHLYSGILDQIEANGYDVFSTRARVPAYRKAATAGRYLAGTMGTRKP